MCASNVNNLLISLTTGLVGGPGNLSESRDRDREREKGPGVAHDAPAHRLDSGSSANNNSGSGVPPQHPDRIKSPSS